MIDGIDDRRPGDRTVTELLEQLAARIPAPGGGVTAAIHGAQAAALLAMVARYSTGERFSEHAVVVTQCTSDADERRRRCLELAGADEAAFTAVSEAYALPRSTDVEKRDRSAVIAAALIGAANPPAEVIVVARELMAIAEALLSIGNKNVITDVAAAADALRAAVTTGRVNVEINLVGISDAATRLRLGEIVRTVDDIVRRADVVSASVRAQLY